MPTNQVILGRPMNRRDETGEIEGVKLFIVGEDGTRNFVFARLSGNDNTGDGSLSNPYRTMQRALEDVPVILPYGQRWFVDITGMGVIDLPDEYNFPLYETGDQQFAINFVAEFPAFFFEGNVNLRAVPAVLDTITPPEVVSIVADPTTGLITLTTTKVWVVNQWQGRHLVSDFFFDASVVVSNTVSALVLSTTFLGGSTFQIVQPSAELRNPNPASFSPAVALRNSSAFVTLQGIKVSHANAAPFVSDVATSGLDIFAAILCEWKGLLAESGRQTLLTALSERDKMIFIGVPEFVVFNSYFESNEFAPFGGAGNRFQSIENVYRSSTAFGHRFGRSETFAFFCQSNHFITPVGNGVTFLGGQHCELTSCKIDGASGDAIFASGPGLLRLLNVDGVGSAGFGLNAKAGSQVQVDAAVSVAGAADVKVGAQASMTWAALFAATSVFDEGLALSEGSRVFV